MMHLEAGGNFFMLKLVLKGALIFSFNIKQKACYKTILSQF